MDYTHEALGGCIISLHHAIGEFPQWLKKFLLAGGYSPEHADLNMQTCTCRPAHARKRRSKNVSALTGVPG